MSEDLCRTEDHCPINNDPDRSITPTEFVEDSKKSYVAPSLSHKEVTVTWRQLSVHVPASEAVHGDTLWSEIDPRELVRKFQKPKEMVFSFPVGP